MAARVVEHHGGAIPNDLDALTALPGVGRKTANVVLGNAFDIASGVVVDTHVKRLAFRLGLTTSRDPVVIERELIALIPKKHWVNLSHRLIDHGRTVCIARKPHCSKCTLARSCPRAELRPPIRDRMRRHRSHGGGFRPPVVAVILIVILH